MLADVYGTVSLRSRAEAVQTGTALSGGVLVLVGAAGIIAGGFGGFVIASRRRRKLPRE